MQTQGRPKRKRQRVQTSCKACFKSKRRCSRKQPCENCALRNIPCEYEAGIRRASTSSCEKRCEEADDDQDRSQASCCETGPSTATESSSVLTSPEVYGNGYIPNGKKKYSTNALDNKATAPDGRGKFYIRQGLGRQKTTMRFFGPSSGPSFLLYPYPVALPEERQERFPKDTIPGIENILNIYRSRFHWIIACVEWSFIEKALDSSNVVEVNNLLYIILALGCISCGKCQDAILFMARSKGAPRDPASLLDTVNDTVTMQYRVCEIFYLDCIGRHEDAWDAVSLAIGKAISMGYHRDTSKQAEMIRQSPQELNTQQRIWHTLIEVHYKYCMVLGRPYFVKSEFTDAALNMPTLATLDIYSYRDCLNQLGPLYRVLLDATLQVELSASTTESLMSLDRKLNGWWGRVAHLYSVRTGVPLDPRKYECYNVKKISEWAQGQNQSETEILSMQFLCLEMYKLFLESRIYRFLMKCHDNDMKANAISRFYTSTRQFSFISNRLYGEDVVYILPDILAFLIDDFLYLSLAKYCCTEREGPLLFVYRQYNDDILNQNRLMITKVADLQTSRMALVAKKALEYGKAIEQKDYTNMVHPVLEINMTDEYRKQMVVQCPHSAAMPAAEQHEHEEVEANPPGITTSNENQPRLSENPQESLDIATALNFDIQDWNQWTSNSFGSALDELLS